MSIEKYATEALQLELLQPINPVERVCGQSLEDRFEAFHAANPHVYRALRTLAMQMRGSGRRRYGIKGLFEVLRWNYALRTQDPASDFNLNNSFTSFYARLLNEDPQLRGMFEMRTQRWQRRRR